MASNKEYHINLRFDKNNHKKQKANKTINEEKRKEAIPDKCRNKSENKTCSQKNFKVDKYIDSFFWREKSEPYDLSTGNGPTAKKHKI